MQRCPKCGYRDRDWPLSLVIVAFGILYVVFVVGGEHAPRVYHLIGLGAFFLFLAGNLFNALRNERNRREFSKSNDVSPKVPSQ